MFNINNQSSLKIIPLGGVGNVTKNMYVYEYENELIVVDCGVGFPDEATPGVDLVIPDISYLLQRKNNLKAFFITHGHDDHIGALPYIIKDFLNIPIFGSRLTSALIEEKFYEFGIQKKVEVLKDDGSINIGKFIIQWAHVTHSIPDALQYIIKTPIGTIYHGSDFKFDWTPIDNKPSEIGKIAEAGKEGILCLLSDCLGAERKGATLSERVISETLEQEINNCPGKFIVTTQSSNISRLKQAIDVGLSHNRLISIVGKSMEKNIEVSKKLGLISIPPEKVIAPEKISNFPQNSLMILISGSQGQDESALSRVANEDHQYVKIEENDVVVFSSDPIPGNEHAVYSLIDQLTRLGARVSYSNVQEELHVSGHGSQNDLKILLSLTKPKFVFPIGGTYRHMHQYSLLCQNMGIPKSNIFLGENGRVLELTKDNAKFGSLLEIDNIMVDGIGIGDVGNIVLRDRKRLAMDGIFICVIPLDQRSGNLAGEIDVVSRGFVYMRESEGLIDEARKVIKDTLFVQKIKSSDWQFIKKKIEDGLGKYFYKKTKRNPMIIAVIIEV